MLFGFQPHLKRMLEGLRDQIRESNNPAYVRHTLSK